MPGHGHRHDQGRRRRGSPGVTGCRRHVDHGPLGPVEGLDHQLAERVRSERWCAAEHWASGIPAPHAPPPGPPGGRRRSSRRRRPTATARRSPAHDQAQASSLRRRCRPRSETPAADPWSTSTRWARLGRVGARRFRRLDRCPGEGQGLAAGGTEPLVLEDDLPGTRDRAAPASLGAVVM